MRLLTVGFGQDDTGHVYYRTPRRADWSDGAHWWSDWEPGETLCGLPVAGRAAAWEGSSLVDTATFERYDARRTCPACAHMVRGLLE